MTNEEAINIVNECLIRGGIISNAHEYQFWETIKFALENQPKHGRWIRVGFDIYECSECKHNVMTSDICAYNFCHGCGANMRGEDDGKE